LIPLPAKQIVRWRWPILALWVLVAAVVIPVASEVHHRLQVGGREPPWFQSTRAETFIRERFATSFSSFAVVVVRHHTLRAADPRYLAYLDSLTHALQREPYVLHTLSGREVTGIQDLQSPDGHTALIVVGLRQVNDNDPPNDIPRLREAVGAMRQAVGAGFETVVTGSPAFDYDTRLVVAEDSRRLERAVIPLSMLLLVIAFGTLVGSAMPIVVGFIAIELTLGVVAMLATFLPMSIFVLNITTMVGLGVGIDYSLLIVTRFREELSSGLTPHEAAVMTIRTASSAVITSGATVMVGLLGLLVVPLSETRSVGLGGLIVVGISILLSISFLPASLAILGPRVEWPLALSRRFSPKRSEAGWMRYAASLARHPIRAVIISASIMGVISLPAVRLKIGLPSRGWFPMDTEAGRGLALLQQMSAGGSLQPIRVVLHLRDGAAVLDPDRLRGLKAISDSIAADPRVRVVRGLVDLRPGIPLYQYAALYGDTARARRRMPAVFQTYLSRDGSATIYDVLLADSVTPNGALAVARRIRGIEARGLPGLAYAELLSGGFAPSSLDFRDELMHRFPALVAIVLGITGIMLGAVFRSVLVPVKAVIMNCFSVAAAFGLTVVVFQWGFGARLIGISGPTEAIFILGPVLVFAIVFGLSMDYEVFLLARIKEEFDASHDNDAATIAGLAATGGTITNAAMIMILVFGAFAFARVIAVQMVGFGLAVAVLLDATVIRIVMVPAVMHLAGRFNWWPGYRRRGAGGHYRRASGTAPPKGPAGV
jgi:RND superfamily putative drug exporter